MAPKKSEKVRKLVPLKVPYEELRPFRHELRELRLEFLLWNWNYVSASIWKEVMDKSATEGEELRGNPMLWTVEHWTKVMGPCAGSDGDLLFDKNSVGLTRVEEFSYGPLFETGRQGTNGWKTVDYKDPKRRAIALGIMHILRPARTTYVTAWQVVARVGGTVVEVEATTLPKSPVEELRPEEGEKTSGEEVKTLEVTFPEFLQDSVVPLLKYLDGKRKKYAVSQEPGFYVQMIRNRTKLKRAVAVRGSGIPRLQWHGSELQPCQPSAQ
ncbi:hypothetical protein AXG93_4003s1040 [Marchantia polymorpha subsp. ruderalis]|uniref:Uncharacterized protein n=1 Tax=Marchantia polymorpha subsp. ruderalis TaxID=1480154 RepID=A0A176WA74_MARPO|nr:hypothetical protein AXG93_4003s1040 [Marchantia polymorpha subsp. ruderalis]